MALLIRRCGATASLTLLFGLAALPVAAQSPVELEMKTLDGGALLLSDLRGQPLVVDFWATWCAPCEGQLRALEALRKSTVGSGVRILVVSIDRDADDARRYLSERFENHGLLTAHDPEGRALSDLRAGGIPALFVFDATGRIRETHFGPGLPEGLESTLSELRSSSGS